MVSVGAACGTVWGTGTDKTGTVEGTRSLCAPPIRTNIINPRDLLKLLFHETIGGDYPNHLVTTNALIKRLHDVIGILVFVE